MHMGRIREAFASMQISLPLLDEYNVRYLKRAQVLFEFTLIKMPGEQKSHY